MEENYTNNNGYGGQVNGYMNDQNIGQSQNMNRNTDQSQNQSINQNQNVNQNRYGFQTYYQNNGQYGTNTQYNTNSQYGTNDQYSANGQYGTGDQYNTNSQYGTGDRYAYRTTYNDQRTGTYSQVVVDEPVKKKSTWKKAVAVVAVAAILVTGVGVSYVGMHRAYKKVSDNLQAKTEQSADEGSGNAGGSFFAKDNDNADQDKADNSGTDSSIKTATTKSSNVTAVVTDVTEVVQNVMPAIVSIHNNYTLSASYFGQVYSEEQTASGSGIIVGKSDTELLIVTNYHVIEGADTLEVIFCNDDTIEAAVKGTDSDMDLAVIAVQLSDISAQTASEISIATLGDSDSLTVGEPAIAIGNALGYGQSVTTGVVSALNRVIDLDNGSKGTFIQTDAAINPGNSGGALLNIKGEVIGINSNKIGGSTIEGMGYAIPMSTAEPIIDKLMNEATKIRVSAEKRGYIGISGVSVTSSVSQAYGMPQGVYIAEVTSGGGAAAAGIQKGDIIMGLDGEEITSMDDLQKRLEYYAAGQKVTLRIARQDGSGYQYGDVDVTLTSSASTKTEDENAAEKGDQYDGSSQPSESGNGFEMPQIPGFNFNFPGSDSDGNGNWNYYEDGNGGKTWEFHFGG